MGKEVKGGMGKAEKKKNNKGLESTGDNKTLEYAWSFLWELREGVRVLPCFSAQINSSSTDV